MKLENNWRNKTIENLENDKWRINNIDSTLVKKTSELRKVPLSEFTIENLRIMIGQQIGLDFLIPLAIEALCKDLYAEGDFFEGDLLQNVLQVKAEFWKNNMDYWADINKLIDYRLKELKNRKIDIENFYSINNL